MWESETSTQREGIYEGEGNTNISFAKFCFLLHLRVSMIWLENEDNKQQEPTESGDTGETGTPETSERRRIETQDSISQYITEDNLQLIIDGIIEGTNLSDLEETGKIYY